VARFGDGYHKRLRRSQATPEITLTESQYRLRQFTITAAARIVWTGNGLAEHRDEQRNSTSTAEAL
jgi:hypothetical protein